MADKLTSLVSASEQFILALEKSEAELRSVSHRLEEEFGDRFKGHSANPHSIVQRLKKVERQLQAVRIDVNQLTTARQDLLEEAGRTVKSTSELIRQLEIKSGVPREDDKSDDWLIASIPGAEAK